MPLCDSHCHFFSSRFLEILTKDLADFPADDRADAVASRLGWEAPGTAEALADRWVAELDRHVVSRSVLIASIPGDEVSVAAAVARYPARFVGFFMFNPLAPDAATRLAHALGEQRMRGIALFPAMHRYRLEDDAVAAVFESAVSHDAAVFVHCGVLSVGVRKKLGLQSPFDVRLGEPLAVAALAQRYPSVPVIIPHFGAGLFREALMAADQCANIHLDTSSSNNWMKYHPGLTLEGDLPAGAGRDRSPSGCCSALIRRSSRVAGSGRVHDAQVAALDAIGVERARSREDSGRQFREAVSECRRERVILSSPVARCCRSVLRRAPPQPAGRVSRRRSC